MASGFKIDGEILVFDGQTLARLDPSMPPGLRLKIADALNEDSAEGWGAKVLANAQKKAKAGLVSIDELIDAINEATPSV